MSQWLARLLANEPESCEGELRGDRQVRIDVGTVLNPHLGQRHIHPPDLPGRIDNGHGRDRHLPAARFYREVVSHRRNRTDLRLDLTAGNSDDKTFQLRSIPRRSRTLTSGGCYYLGGVQPYIDRARLIDSAFGFFDFRRRAMHH